jgi:hypothetical protein
MMFLSAFGETYTALLPKGHGPRIPVDEAKLSGYLEKAAKVVLGSGETDDKEGDGAGTSKSSNDGTGALLGATYDDVHRSRFPLYRYLFLSGSKPVAHARALASLDDTTIASKCPDVLRRLVLRARDLAEKYHA